MDLGPGSVFADYRIERELGRGGMGVVYLAEQISLSRRVALKVISPHLADDLMFRARFTEEARAAAAIEHPNVVPVYAADVHDGHLFMAMRYIDGTDLAARLQLETRLSPISVTQIARAMGDALDAAHQAGLVHRDVKPANILLAGAPANPHVYLTDFGLAKEAGSASGGLTSTGQWVGTLNYIAPEQIEQGSLDARTDVYALGCVLFQALSGRLPFEGTDAQKMWGHTTKPVPPLSGLDPRTSQAIDSVLARALAKNPTDRYPSAGDLARATGAALSGQSVNQAERTVATGSAAPTGATEPIASPSATEIDQPAPVQPQDKPPRRGRAIAGVVAVSVLLALAAGAAVFASRDSEGPQPRAVAATSDERDRTVTVERPAAPTETSETEAPESIAKPPVAPPSSDPEPPATDSAPSGDWPAGAAAYTTILGSFKSRSEAQGRASAAGSPAGVLRTDDYPGLTPGYWAVFSGQHETSGAAQSATQQWRSSGYSDAYVRFVDGSGG